MGARSRRKSAVQDNTESRFSSWVIKRIHRNDPKKGPEKNTCFVDFDANCGLQTGPQNGPEMTQDKPRQPQMAPKMTQDSPKIGATPGKSR